MKWLEIGALQKFSRRKCDCCLPLLSSQAIGLYGIPRQFNSNNYYERENQTNSACQSNQVLIETFAVDIDFMSLVHF